MAAAHILTNGQYGFHRDELQFLADGRHLDWGFVVYPPITPLLAHISTSVFGLSLVGVRLIPVLAQAICILLAGLTARELGGNRRAQIVTSAAVALSPMSIHYGTELMYSSFDYLWWILTAYLLVRLIKSDNPRWWVAIGLALGIGLETKYTILFYICGILLGIIFTPCRKYLYSAWFWAGVATTVALILPNIVWELKHQFISVYCLHSIHVRDLQLGRDKNFLGGQLLSNVNPFAAPVWILGLIVFLRHQDRRYRLFAFAYAIPLLLFIAAKARYYYVAPAYPVLLAMGAVTCERWLGKFSSVRQRVAYAVFFICLSAYGVIAFLAITPWATGGKARDRLLASNVDLRDEIGWNELVRTTAHIRDNLPPSQRDQVGVIAGNYGEAGAIENLGPSYHLPAPISGANSWWLRSYPTHLPTTLIVIGYTKEEAEAMFANCNHAAEQSNPLGVHNQETDVTPDIFVCGPPRQPWPELWPWFKRYQ